MKTEKTLSELWDELLEVIQWNRFIECIYDELKEGLVLLLNIIKKIKEK